METAAAQDKRMRGSVILVNCHIKYCLRLLYDICIIQDLIPRPRDWNVAPGEREACEFADHEFRITAL